jgi:hypothetical protein
MNRTIDLLEWMRRNKWLLQVDWRAKEAFQEQNLLIKSGVRGIWVG